MIRTQIQLTEEQSRRVKEVARRKNISMAELIRRAIDNWLNKHNSMSMSEKRQRALDVVREMDGMFHSGLSDMAENHDEYLADAFGDYEPRTDIS
jgi:metal-responsive CopG/Arc/MetJ family transcriptional regulator